jgi:hypothetical protein
MYCYVLLLIANYCGLLRLIGSSSLFLFLIAWVVVGDAGSDEVQTKKLPARTDSRGSGIPIESAAGISRLSATPYRISGVMLACAK